MKRKRKKAFVITKVKPKLVFVPPKKFWGRKIAGTIFLVLGSAILTSTIFIIFLIPTFFQKECPTNMVEIIPKEEPKILFIPKLNLELPIVKAKIEKGQWELPEQTVAYLPGSSLTSKRGNLVIFGNNNLKVLGRLPLLKFKDKIYLLGESQYFVFEVEEAKTVLPTDETIFKDTEEKTLTIFSTPDYLKGKRFVVKTQKIP